jgi:hypothetical protein
MPLRIDAVRFHRNGCHGQGFYAVDFREREGRKFVRRVAAVFVDGDDILERRAELPLSTLPTSMTRDAGTITSRNSAPPAKRRSMTTRHLTTRGTEMHKQMKLCGVAGDLLWEPRDDKLFDRQRWISEWRVAKPGYGKGAIIQAEVRFDDNCKNGHNTFAVTGTVTTGDRNSRGLDILAGGCLHDEVAKAFPELAHLIRWHLCDADSGPMHGVANAVYMAGDLDHWGKRAGEPTRFETVVTFGDVPMPFKLSKGLETFLAEIADYDPEGKQAALIPLAVAYQCKPGETYRFEPKWQFAGQPPLEWHACPFDTEEQAERFAKSVLNFKTTIEQLPVAFSEGKPRELDAARRAAVWPEATDEQLCAPRDELKAALEARIPALVEAMRADITAAGFAWTPADLKESANA